MTNNYCLSNCFSFYCCSSICAESNWKAILKCLRHLGVLVSKCCLFYCHNNVYCWIWGFIPNDLGWETNVHDDCFIRNFCYFSLYSHTLKNNMTWLRRIKRIPHYFTTTNSGKDDSISFIVQSLVNLKIKTRVKLRLAYSKQEEMR